LIEGAHYYLVMLVPPSLLGAPASRAAFVCFWVFVALEGIFRFREIEAWALVGGAIGVLLAGFIFLQMLEEYDKANRRSIRLIFSLMIPGYAVIGGALLSGGDRAEGLISFISGAGLFAMLRLLKAEWARFDEERPLYERLLAGDKSAALDLSRLFGRRRR
jgi:hypothetical protein